jgi:hypothetical protein
MMLDLEHMDDESLKRLHDIYERLGVKRDSTRTKKLDLTYPLVGLNHHCEQSAAEASQRFS